MSEPNVPPKPNLREYAAPVAVLLGLPLLLFGLWITPLWWAAFNSQRHPDLGFAVSAFAVSALCVATGIWLLYRAAKK